MPYLVVDYVDGMHIDKYCDTHKLGVEERLKLFLEVCGAVHYAHQSLVVHCDLKPSNILVTKEGVPMLLDFGIAKLLDPASMGLATNIAQTRQRAFTPSYASPEQLSGQPVTTAADVYALGVILYELLTGLSLYASADLASPAAWIKSVCEDDAPAPSTTIPIETPERNSRALRGDLDAIELKALRKNPRDRYGSVDQMAEDIRRHLTGQPVLARKNTTPYAMRKFLGGIKSVCRPRQLSCSPSPPVWPRRYGKRESPSGGSRTSEVWRTHSCSTFTTRLRTFPAPRPRVP